MHRGGSKLLVGLGGLLGAGVASGFLWFMPGWFLVAWGVGAVLVFVFALAII